MTGKRSKRADLKRANADLLARNSILSLTVAYLSRRLTLTNAILADAEQRQGPPDDSAMEALPDAAFNHYANCFTADSMEAVCDGCEAGIADLPSSSSREAMRRAIAETRRGAATLRALGKAATAPMH
ncbi:MAG: hypothetical protein F4027_07465 [Rhodospirillaceae bacterium]|nr:hypothetical protein [Rhodospirillaceae bacterium]